jgi:hypothetical protein
LQMWMTHHHTDHVPNVCSHQVLYRFPNAFPKFSYVPIYLYTIFF